MLFNPFKLIWNTICVASFSSLLFFTHYQAFRVGATIHQNPLAEKAAEMTGILPKKEPSPGKQDENSFWSDAASWFQSLTTPKQQPPKR